MLYGSGVPDVVGAFPVKDFGKVSWSGNSGSYFGQSFAKVADPQCANVSAVLTQYCTLQAVSDASSGKLLLQNPQPGTRGSLGRQSMELPGNWNFDASLGKNVKISESKSVVVRMDATNVFNHPVPSAPVLNINSTSPFGYIADKGTQIRQFKGSLRFSF
jgi:hypothetical protein